MAVLGTGKVYLVCKMDNSSHARIKELGTFKIVPEMRSKSDLDEGDNDTPETEECSENGEIEAYTEVLNTDGKVMVRYDDPSENAQKTPITEDTTPNHYNLDPEPIDVIKAWDLDFCLGNVLKYIARAGKKDGESKEKDLRKAIHYLNYAIEDCG